MKCSEARRRMAGLFDRSSETNGPLEAHLEVCLECTHYLEGLRQTFAALEPDNRWSASPQLKERIMINTSQYAATPVLPKRRSWSVLTAAGAAAVLLVVASLGMWYARTGGTQPLTASVLLGQAAYAMANLETVHIKATMRTHPDGNFEEIALTGDPVNVELWKRFGQPDRWRIEKPGRVLVMDGERTTLWIPSVKATAEGTPDCGMVEWLRPLLDPETLLNRETELAAKEGSSLSMARETGPDGREEEVVRIESSAKGDFSRSTYTLNTSIVNSDNLRIYRFDPDTKRLTALQVYVHLPQGDVLVFNTESVQYDEPLDDSLFALTIPADAVRFVQPEATEAVPEAATPEGAARSLLEACAAQDWARALRMLPFSAMPEGLKAEAGELQILSIGTPFQAGTYGGWFVPYEVKMKSGEIKKGNMALRNDNPANQYILDGGF